MSLSSLFLFPEPGCASYPPFVLPSSSFVGLIHPSPVFLLSDYPCLCSLLPPHLYPPMLADWYLLINVTKASLLLMDLIREIGCPFLSIFYYLRLPEPPQATTYPLVVLGMWTATDTQLKPCVPSGPPRRQSPKFPLCDWSPIESGS